MKVSSCKGGKMMVTMLKALEYEYNDLFQRFENSISEAEFIEVRGKEATEVIRLSLIHI